MLDVKVQKIFVATWQNTVFWFLERKKQKEM